MLKRIVARRRLKFNNPVFNDDVNITCRLGSSWANVAGEIVLVDKGSVMVDALVTETICTKFSNIDKDMLELEHDPKCRTPEGLFEVMKEIYKDEFDEESYVTLVRFRFIKNRA